MRINHSKPESEGNSSDLRVIINDIEYHPINDDVKSNIVNSKFKLFIGTLSYNGHFCGQFMSSLIKTLKDLWEKGVETEVHYSNNNPFIEVARNKIVEEFLASESTHLLMIDADQGWEASKVYDMLMFDRQVISGAVPIKDPDKENYMLEIHKHLNSGKPIGESDTGLISVENIGAAFLMVRRDAFEQIRSFNTFRYLRALGQNYYSFFEVMKANGRFVGEDMTFCERCKEAGVKIWMLPDINMEHLGYKVWKGNYHEYLMRLPGGLNDPDKSQGLRIKKEE